MVVLRIASQVCHIPCSFARETPVSAQHNILTTFHTAPFAWFHPGGQILVIVDGTGYYQEQGSPKRIIKKGDTIKCPPNVPHWHGASKDEKLIQIAITNNQTV